MNTLNNIIEIEFFQIGNMKFTVGTLATILIKLYSLNYYYGY